AEDLFKNSCRGFLLAKGTLYRRIYCAAIVPASTVPGRGCRDRVVPERGRIGGPGRRRGSGVSGRRHAFFPRLLRFAAGAGGHRRAHPIPPTRRPSRPAPTAGPTSSPVPSDSAARQQFVPDLIAAVPGGITPAQLAKIRKLGGVAAVLPVDGGKVTVNGQGADVLGVSPQAFRPWTPLATAASATIWSDLSQGQLISTAAAARKLHLTAGQSYPVSAAILE